MESNTAVGGCALNKTAAHGEPLLEQATHRNWHPWRSQVEAICYWRTLAYRKAGLIVTQFPILLHLWGLGRVRRMEWSWAWQREGTEEGSVIFVLFFKLSILPMIVMGKWSLTFISAPSFSLFLIPVYWITEWLGWKRPPRSSRPTCVLIPQLNHATSMVLLRR